MWMLVAAFMFACMGVLVKLGAAIFPVLNWCFTVHYLVSG
jgi:hypothetical protein